MKSYVKKTKQKQTISLNRALQHSFSTQSAYTVFQYTILQSGSKGVLKVFVGWLEVKRLNKHPEEPDNT